ncbi:MAG: PEP/pyruvate-binding domain-containing protein [Planctomycetota bacterium]
MPSLGTQGISLAGLGALGALLLGVGPAAGLSGADAPAPDYLLEVQTAEDFAAISVPSEIPRDFLRATKYLVPAREDPSLLPPVFQNVQKYPLHQDFLRIVFPERFPGLDTAGYLALVEVRATREYFAGAIFEFETEEGPAFGFSVFTRDPDVYPAELLSLEEVRAVRERIAAAFHLRPFGYAPRRPAEVAEALRWTDPGFPIYTGSARPSYEAYTRAVGYGWVRRLRAQEFEDAAARGRIGWRDILVLERAPSDIEGVVAGVITAEPQDELTHVAVRTARRGTPNAYVERALEVFEPWEGKLVRLEVLATEYRASEAGASEAEAWWESSRPSLSRPPSVDRDYDSFDSLEEMDLSGAERPPVARYGGKATNFAKLQRILTGERAAYREPGFAIPVRWYLEFLRANWTKSALDPKRSVTYEEHLRELLSSERFEADPEYRHASLAAFREEVERRGQVDPVLVGLLLGRIAEVFGAHDVPVRFRSSSNIEDSLEFNGAGLYDSTTACAADDLDADVAGPSLCNPAEPDERTLSRALKRVWASLWSFRANEERSYYGIDAEDVAMGILVTRAFLDEGANGVAFTGNPANALDRRYLVLAQVGEESVVSPDPGKRAEKSLLEVEGGAVRAIERVRPSSLVAPGEFVMSDAKLRELGELLAYLDAAFPIDLEGHERSEVLLDVEFKVEASGKLAVKQIRPFLLSEPPAPGPTFELVVPEGTVLCGVFLDGRKPLEELAAKSRLRLRPGTYLLPTAAPAFHADLIEEVLYGSPAGAGVSKAPGAFSWTARSEGTGEVTYEFTYRETFSLPGGEELSLALSSLQFHVRGGEPLETAQTLDEEYATRSLVLSGTLGSGPAGIAVRYGPCGYELLPLWRLRVELEDGTSLDLEERYQPVGTATAGPANLVAAVVAAGGETQEVRDYWRLVYAAEHHNEDVRHLVLLDPPIASEIAARPVFAIEVLEPDIETRRPAEALYRGLDLGVVARPRVLCYDRAPPGRIPGCRFRRGDVDSGGSVNITDAVFLILHLFRSGAAPTCLDAADFDDDGVLDLADAVLLLSFLFRGVDLSAPPGPSSCGVDPTLDSFPGCDDPSCR